MAKMLKQMMFCFGDLQRYGIPNGSTLREVLLGIPKKWSPSAKCCLEWSQGASPLWGWGCDYNFM